MGLDFWILAGIQILIFLNPQCHTCLKLIGKDINISDLTQHYALPKIFQLKIRPQKDSHISVVESREIFVQVESVTRVIIIH